MTETYDQLGGQPTRPASPARVVKTFIPAHSCNHSDNHVCPWITQEDGSIKPCGCTRRPAGGNT